MEPGWSWGRGGGVSEAGSEDEPASGRCDSGCLACGGWDQGP